MNGGKGNCVPDRFDNRCAVRANGIMTSPWRGNSSFIDHLPWFLTLLWSSDSILILL